jgi:hypothetical protein
MGEAKRVYRARDGVARTLITDDANPFTVTVQTTSDIEPVLDSIKRDQETMSHSGPNKLAARIPLFLYEELQRQGITEDESLFKAWLNSSEAEPWRIWRGRL